MRVLSDGAAARRAFFFKNSPKLVVTDSQAFGAVKKMLPESQRLTSFSILLAYVNGILSEAVKGAAALSELKDGDTVLIAEGAPTTDSARI